MKHKTRTFQDHLKENLKDTEFKKYYQQEGVKLKIAFQIAELRRKRGLTQTQLARKLGTSQGNIARLESADTDNYEVSTLERIAATMGKTLVVAFR
ncbi:MAG: helix-turn-helix transcriptional regulator [Elusimicrobia bacterium]|nr:helix-turn-helix transcriptional regulator [Elusimicrobiota bacterium]MBP9127574.1 helix-turn-helix transcriptional regulator [Elusimicrobiota bacterium]